MEELFKIFDPMPESQSIRGSAPRQRPIGLPEGEDYISGFWGRKRKKKPKSTLEQILQGASAVASGDGQSEQPRQAGSSQLQQGRGMQETGNNLGLVSDLGGALSAHARGRVGLESIYEAPGIMEIAEERNIARIKRERDAREQEEEIRKLMEEANQAGLKTTGLEGIMGFGQGGSAVPGGSQPVIDPITGKPQIDPETGEMVMREPVDQRQAMMSNLLLAGYTPREAAQMAQAQTALDPTMTDTDIIRSSAGAGDFIGQDEAVSLEGQTNIREDKQEQERRIDQMQNAMQLEKQRLINQGNLAEAREVSNRQMQLEELKTDLAIDEDLRRKELGLVGTGDNVPKWQEKYMEETAKNLAEQEAGLTDYISQSESLVPKLDEALSVIDDANMDAYTRFADTIADSDPTGLGSLLVDADAKGKRKIVNSVLVNQVLAQASQLSGPKSDKDIELLEEAATGGAVSEEEVKAALQRVKADIEQQRKAKIRQIETSRKQLGLGRGAAQEAAETSTITQQQEAKPAGKVVKFDAEGNIIS